MNPSYRLTASTGIHKGDRDYQQDQVALLQHPHAQGCILGIVADGVGGRSGGRNASDQVLMTARQLLDRFNPAMDDAQAMLAQVVQDAHTVIRLTAISTEQEPHSTMAAFVVLPSGACHWAHSGDSRIYHYQGAHFVKRTLDHSYVQSLVNGGEISEEQALVHPQAHILTGCLGTDKPPPVDFHVIPRLVPGDVLMACTDGIWHYFNLAELGSVLSELSAREATEFLVGKARTRARGTGDNLSLVVVKIEALA
jgi:serine/threonine protein phosphatase PrpC